MHFKIWLENNHPFPNSTIPYLVYHGTDKNPFHEFKYQKSQRFVMLAKFDVQTNGFFFSESPHDALEFGKNVVACYVNLQNPLIDPRYEKTLSYQKEIDVMKILAPMIQKDKNGHFIDYMITKNYLQHNRRSSSRDWIYDAIDKNGIVWEVLDNPNVIQKMKNLGYDGTFVYEPHSYLGRSIFVINPNQIHIVNWIEQDPSWGDKDDWYLKNKNGLQYLYTPHNKE